jgi:hypothetical protein
MIRGGTLEGRVGFISALVGVFVTFRKTNFPPDCSGLRVSGKRRHDQDLQNAA